MLPLPATQNSLQTLDFTAFFEVTHLLPSGGKVFVTTEELIKKTVTETVLRLKVAGLMKDTNKSPHQKTEELLRNYQAFTLSGNPAAEKMIQRIEMALQVIKEDPYYDVIVMYYIKGKTREDIADLFNTSVTTISRNKTRLISRITPVLFAEDYIMQLYT